MIAQSTIYLAVFSSGFFAAVVIGSLADKGHENSATFLAVVTTGLVIYTLISASAQILVTLLK